MEALSIIFPLLLLVIDLDDGCVPDREFLEMVRDMISDFRELPLSRDIDADFLELAVAEGALAVDEVVPETDGRVGIMEVILLIL